MPLHFLNFPKDLPSFGFLLKQTLRQGFACKSFIWEMQDAQDGGYIVRQGRGGSPAKVLYQGSIPRGDWSLTPGEALGTDVKHLPQNYMTQEARKSICTPAPKSCRLQLSWLEHLVLNLSLPWLNSLKSQYFYLPAFLLIVSSIRSQIT